MFCYLGVFEDFGYLGSSAFVLVAGQYKDQSHELVDVLCRPQQTLAKDADSLCKVIHCALAAIHLLPDHFDDLRVG